MGISQMLLLIYVDDVIFLASAKLRQYILSVSIVVWQSICHQREVMVVTSATMITTLHSVMFLESRKSSMEFSALQKNSTYTFESDNSALMLPPQVQMRNWMRSIEMISRNGLQYDKVKKVNFFHTDGSNKIVCTIMN